MKPETIRMMLACLMGMVLGICNIWWYSWQFWLILLYCTGWSVVSKMAGYDDGVKEGNERAAATKKYYEEQFERLGQKDKIL